MAACGKNVEADFSGDNEIADDHDGPARPEGGYEYDFVSPPPSDYECPVCLLTLRDPQIVNCCGLKFCLSCIEHVHRSNKPCPLCKQRFEFMPERQLKRRIGDLEVRCPRRKAGCEWVGELRRLEEVHLAGCPLAEVACSLGCGANMPRCRRQEHELDHCCKRSTEAKFHSLTQRLEKRIIHLEERCRQQDEEIDHLKEVARKGERGVQEAISRHKEDTDTLKKEMDSEFAALHSKRRDMFAAIGNALMKRCFSFNFCFSHAAGKDWVSPPFFSHHNGYQLQLTAELSRPKQSSLDMIHRTIHGTLFQVDRQPVTISLHVLPQERDKANLDWPVYVTVEILVLSNCDKKAHGKVHTLIEHKTLSYDDTSSQTRGRNRSVIGYAEGDFDCRILIVRIEHSVEVPDGLEQ